MINRMNLATVVAVLAVAATAEQSNLRAREIVDTEEMQQDAAFWGRQLGGSSSSGSSSGKGGSKGTSGSGKGGSKGSSGSG
eukprot:CAMPEP_0185801788 /NCGR_PEP_ID=MMETSP1322-20130828/1634_1 /TAXON_ID=265543 /ORGANISM="Minutocellus polymorphus, Strain RCC2270" /LENGTH=80 /DNA_ID=CAMNT_0028497505 /DNA_START=55 /DNA_END=293 /DNA_ORIENTATION=+